MTPAVFAKIRHGDKIIEPRLHDADHRRVRLGDLIIVKDRTSGAEIITKVVGVLRYKTFVELFTAYDPSYFGGQNRDQLLQEVRQWYSPQNETAHGVIGIKLHRLMVNDE